MRWSSDRLFSDNALRAWHRTALIALALIAAVGVQVPYGALAECIPVPDAPLVVLSQNGCLFPTMRVWVYGCDRELQVLSPSPQWDYESGFYGTYRSQCEGSDGHFHLFYDFQVQREFCCDFWGGGFDDGGIRTDLGVYVRVDSEADSVEFTRTDAGTISCSHSGTGSPASISASWSGVPEAGRSVAASPENPESSVEISGTETFVRPLGQFPISVLDPLQWPGVRYALVTFRGAAASWSAGRSYGGQGGVVTGARAGVEVAIDVRVRKPDTCPIAKIEGPTACVAACGDPFAITSTSYDPDDGESPGAGIVSWEWTCPDGCSCNVRGNTLWVQADSPGSYDFILRVTDDDAGSQDSTHQLVDVGRKKALIVEGTGMGPLGLLAELQYNLLEAKGWDADVMHADGQAMFLELCERLKDPCLKGLIMIAHGPECKDYSGEIRDEVNLPNGQGGLSGFRPSGSLPQCMPSGKHLDFLRMINCNVNELVWGIALHADLTIPACARRHPTLSPNTTGCPGDLVPGEELDCEILTDNPRFGGTNPYPEACPLNPPTLARASSPFAGLRGSTCSSLPECDENGACGDTLFPVVECADSIGTPIAGGLSLILHDSGCRVDADWGATLPDTAAVVATLFSKVPERLVVPGSVYLPRVLFAYTIAPSNVGADSVRIVLPYTDEEVAEAGVSEQDLRMSWLAADSSAARIIAATQDLSANTLQFTAGGSGGVAGICYVPPSSGACCAADGSCTTTTEDVCIAPSTWHGSASSCTPNPCQPLSSGVYPINGTDFPPTSFATLTTAIAYMVNQGVADPGQVVLELSPGYAGEPGPLSIPEIPGVVATPGLTVRPAAGYSPVTSVAGTNGNRSAILVTGSHVTLDGRAGGTGTGRDWTIRCTGSGPNGYGESAVRLDNTTNAVTDVTVRNCVLEAEAANGSSAILAVTGGAAHAMTNVLLDHNLVRSTGNDTTSCRGYGALVSGPNHDWNTGLVIRDNIVNQVACGGIWLGDARFPGTEVYGNEIFHTAPVMQRVAGPFAGITFSSTSMAGSVLRDNFVHDLRLANGASWVAGVYLSKGNSYGARVRVFNNRVDIGAAIQSTSIAIYGIHAATGTNYGPFDLDYNSVYLGGSQTAGTSKSAALCLSATANASFKVRDNILRNARSNWGMATGVHWGISISGTACLAALGHNDYYADGGGGVLGTTNGLVSGSRYTLAQWQSSVPGDSQSITQDPHYRDPAATPPDLGIDAAVATQLESGGVAVSGIDADYAGNTRQGSAGYAGTGTAPDIGAEEFDGVSYEITALPVGVYPVNGVESPPTSFASLYTAIAYLTAGGATGTGQIVFELSPGYAGEPGRVWIPQINGLSETLGLTVRPAAGYAALTSVAGLISGRYAIRVTGSHVTLDGRAGGTGAGRDWTIRCTGSGSTGCGESAVRLDNSLNSVADVAVQNCVLEGEAASGMSAILAVTGGSVFTMKRVTLEGNLIRSMGSDATNCRGYGLDVSSASNAGNSNLVIRNNTVSQVAYGGITLGNASFPEAQVYGNEIYHTTPLTQPVSGTFQGLAFGSTTMPGAVVRENFVHDIQLTNGSSWAAGMYLSNGNGSGARVRVYNNRVSIGAGIQSTAVPVYGIYVATGTSYGPFDIDCNSVSVGGTLAEGSTNSAAFCLSATSNASINVRNNVFSNARSNAGVATGTHWGISISGTTCLTILNHNDYFVSGAGGVMATNNGQVLGNRYLMTQWQVAVPQDAQSVTEDPHYRVPAATPPDLTVDPSVATRLESGGVQVSGIDADFLGDVRQGSPGYAGTGTAPDMGADEFEGVPRAPDPALGACCAPGGSCSMTLPEQCTEPSEWQGIFMYCTPIPCVIDGLSQEFGIYVDPAASAEALSRDLGVYTSTGPQSVDAFARGVGVYPDPSAMTNLVTRDVTAYADPVSVPDAVARETGIYVDLESLAASVAREFGVSIDPSVLGSALARQYGMYVDPSVLADAIARDYTMSINPNQLAEALTREFAAYFDPSPEGDGLTRDLDIFTGELPTSLASLDPRSTYLRTNQDADAQTPMVISLSSIIAAPGDPIRICRLGNFAMHPDSVETGRGICAVFSRTATVDPDPAAELRVPDRVPVGHPPDGATAFLSPPTLVGGLPTDIPEDFASFDCVTVTIPDSAQYLIVGAVDDYFGDNSDANGDFAVWVVNLNTTDAPPAADDSDLLPVPFGISEVRPNPSDASCVFSVAGIGKGSVDVGIFDVGGRRVCELSPEQVGSGRAAYRWNGRDGNGRVAPAGVYFIRVKTHERTGNRTIIRIR